jgi:plastocyanin
MGRKRVKLQFDGDAIVTDPLKVVVAPGDTIVWTSDQGDVVVSIDDPVAVEGKTFHGRKGQETSEAKIRRDAPHPRHVVCNASIGGRSAVAYGFDIEP